MTDEWNITNHRWQNDNDRGKPEHSKKEHFTLPIFPTQIPRGLPREGTRTNARPGG